MAAMTTARTPQPVSETNMLNRPEAISSDPLALAQRVERRRQAPQIGTLAEAGRAR
jgi:hypothetical protein